MTVDCVIFDVSGTLVHETTGRAQDDIADAIDRLRASGVYVIAAGNPPPAALKRSLRQAGLTVDDIVSSRDVGINKGSPRWINYICSMTGLRRNQLFYVGDTRHDMVTAVQGSVVYAHAAWSKPAGKYGLIAPAPGWVPAIVEHIFRKPQPWYWELDATDITGRPIWVRTLINAKGAGDLALQRGLLSLLKSDQKPSVGRLTLRAFVMLHMLASLYDSDVLSTVDYWTTYPGHRGSRNKPMAGPLDKFAKLFRQQHYIDLLDRHTRAQQSREAYKQGNVLGAFANQIGSVRLNPKAADDIAGKQVLVIDNYITRGPSTETARNLLLAAGASKVLVAAVSKYELAQRGYEYSVFSPQASVTFDPFTTERPPESQFTRQQMLGTKNPAALDTFAASYRSMLTEQW